MTSTLRYPPGLNIHYHPSSSLQLSGNQENAGCLQQQQDAVPSCLDIQPRIRSLHLPIRSSKSRGPMVQIDGTSILRKRLGHATVMIACARQRVNRRRAALQAAAYAQLFNFTGEWSSDDDDSQAALWVLSTLAGSSFGFGFGSRGNVSSALFYSRCTFHDSYHSYHDV